MKHLFLYSLVVSLLGGCAAMKPPERKVVGNTFYSSSPKLEVEVSLNLEYVGEKMDSEDVEEIHEGADFKFFQKAFVFQGPNQLKTVYGSRILITTESIK
jgi:hypothetical protein